MKLERLAMVLMAGSFSVTTLQAAVPVQADIDAALADIRTDSALFSQWISDQLRIAVPYNANVGAVVPSQLKLFGVELGVSGVVSGTKMDEDGLHALPTRVLNTRSLDSTSRMPFPAVLAHAKLGLPFGMDAGVRLGGIPEKEFDEQDTKIKVKNKIVGMDVRKAVIKEGIGIPGVTVGLSYTHTDGEIDWTTTDVTYNSQIVANGNTFNTSSTGQTAAVSKWKTDSVGLEAILHKKVLVLTPYIGARVNRNSGDVDTSITTTGNITITDPNSTASQTQAVSVTGTGTREADKWDTHLVLGTEISMLPFLKLGIHGDYAGTKKMAGILDLHFQFR